MYRILPVAAALALALPWGVEAQGRGPNGQRDTARAIRCRRVCRSSPRARSASRPMSAPGCRVDVSPDGRTIVFDLLGDLYTMPIAGGKATPLTRGMAFDAQPRFSPDGKQIVFVCDRGGGSNLWIMSLDKRDTVQVTRERAQSFDSPEWTPDGKYIVVSRGNNLYMFHEDGGSGRADRTLPPRRRAGGGPGGGAGVTIAQASAPRSARTRATSGSRSAAARVGLQRPDRATTYSLQVYDRETGQQRSRAKRWGSAFRPTLSPDGKWLVYGTRYDQQTGLRIRDLETARSGGSRIRCSATTRSRARRSTCIPACRSRRTRST